jgi:hypothetical protein
LFPPASKARFCMRSANKKKPKLRSNLAFQFFEAKPQNRVHER